MLDTIRQDLRYAIRGLRRKPGFSIAVILTLGLGIGANTAMFGIVDRLLFRPPPLLSQPDLTHRLYMHTTFRGQENTSSGTGYARYTDFATNTSTFDLWAAHTTRDLPVGVGESAREMRFGIVSASFFRFFDAPPALGRYFTAAEDSPPEGSPVVVLSHAMWQSQYGGRRDVLGETVQIGPLRYTIVGVTPRGFVGLWEDRPPAAFIPITSYAGFAASNMRFDTSWWLTYQWGWMSMLARRKPDVPVVAASADLSQAYVRSYQKQLDANPRANPIDLARPRATAGSILIERGPNATRVGKVATWVGGVSVIVLLIACANVANLLLARALRRRREIALRLALGVSRGRLVSQLLTESMVLAIAGGLAGLGIAHWGGAVLRGTLLERSEAAAGFRDPSTVLFALAVALGVGLLTGLAPIFQTRRTNLTVDLKSGAREGTVHRSRTRAALLVFQGALSVVLLIGAGLFVRSMHNIQTLRMGYDVNPILIVNLNMRGVALDTAERVALRQRLMESARGTPGVVNAAITNAVPFWSMWSTSLFVTGIDTVGRLGQFNLNAVSPDYFATAGTRILRGRGITEADRSGAMRAMVVTESMGRVLWPDRDPLGQCIRVNADTMPCTQVVGITEDIRQGFATEENARASYYYFLSADQFARGSGALFVRTAGRAERYAEAVRRRLQQEMPGASYVTVQPFSEIVGRQTQAWRLGATMFAAFGALALALAAIGLYSVIAYNVTQRTHEMGVRVALGAQVGDVVRLVLSDGMRLAAIGIAIGGAVSLWAVKFVGPLLFEQAPRDPAVFAFVAFLLLGVALAASWIPARRAARVDPNVALRSE